MITRRGHRVAVFAICKKFLGVKCTKIVRDNGHWGFGGSAPETMNQFRSNRRVDVIAAEAN